MKGSHEHWWSLKSLCCWVQPLGIYFAGRTEWPGLCVETGCGETQRPRVARAFTRRMRLIPGAVGLHGKCSCILEDSVQAVSIGPPQAGDELVLGSPHGQVPTIEVAFSTSQGS